MKSFVGRWVRRLCIGSALLGVAQGCGSEENGAPVLQPIGPQEVAVGTELQIALRASDPDGNSITFSYKTDIDISDRAGIQPGGAGTAIFSWVPIGSDVGIHPLTLIASDGSDQGKQTIEVNVKSAIGGAGTPIFRKPLGTGTTLDLSVKGCVDVPIEIEDSDTVDVQIGQEPPLIDGATLNASGSTGTWQWCPNSAQIDGGELYPLVLSAYDGDHAKVLKDYLIVLQKGGGANCPGEGPVITHSPSDQSTSLDLAIDATVTDDLGLKYEPLLYYSDVDPGPTPDLGAMTQLTMFDFGGIWTVDIPNPVAAAPPGSSATVYYVIVARDNDDKEGDCDHTTRSPPTGAHAMNVTSSGTSGGLTECKSCSSDVQCGGADDNCFYIGSQTFCGSSCGSDFDCPLDYLCSASPLPSVDGALARQCVPLSGKCGTVTPVGCTDDSNEEDDFSFEARTADLNAGAYKSNGQEICAWDDDWYAVELYSGETVRATLKFTQTYATQDLDLYLYDPSGSQLTVCTESDPLSCDPANGQSGNSNENLSWNISTQGTYYVVVHGWDGAENGYDICIDYTSSSKSSNGCPPL
jgi:hypothetical protein